ncbi:FCD domain-containing protein [Reinekea marinisedimentorum]|uniref:GntR family uxuAB operon transcriptional repressor n=1 Tax=Reinekea marinisedimentorum TaxID=230495 RepID=A0A4V2UK65_9GAMM|nr:FCD domain-containing protein [Reinekea marinisedimentorum]TCS43012.1 GntR family uxuAB operon transcriptional repressor [Reinekea marinisedimentorum]
MRNFEPKRPYQKVGLELRRMLVDKDYKVGDKLPAERDIAELLGVTRTVVREALIMLELENLIEVRKGSGVFIIDLPSSTSGSQSLKDDVGPFELLQARQLLESNIAEFAALQATPKDISNMREALDMEISELSQKEGKQYGDKEFHLCVARATQNSVLVDMLLESWERRENSPMWEQLHSRIRSTKYQELWLQDHSDILLALQKKDPVAAKRAMWQHLENVKFKLFELSDIDDPSFDGYLFKSNPVVLSENN